MTKIELIKCHKTPENSARISTVLFRNSLYQHNKYKLKLLHDYTVPGYLGEAVYLCGPNSSASSCPKQGAEAVTMASRRVAGAAPQ